MDELTRSGSALLRGHPEGNTISRRGFLQAAIGMTAAAVVIGCSDDTASPGTGGDVNLGGGDTGVLNYAYALEQLEAAFYTQVTASFFAGATAEEKQVLADLRDHEIAHREFLKAALGSNAIGALEVNFGSINFNDRQSVLTTARTFEDLGVAAYNGAGKLFSTTQGGRDLLTIAGKIVSVEARHAAAIRDLLAPRTTAFASAEVVDANGLDKAMAPAQVLAAAAPFIRTKINASNLPTS
jgi:hypothetical protein